MTARFTDFGRDAFIGSTSYSAPTTMAAIRRKDAITNIALRLRETDMAALRDERTIDDFLLG